MAQATGRLEEIAVNGYPDGTFKPEANVTYAEALKMILCALGYKPETFRSITWPVTWVAKAMQLGISEGVPLASGAANLPAVRGDIARLVDNALDEPMLVQTGYGDEVTYEVDEDETLLAHLGYEKVSGRVVDIALTNGDLDENEVKLDDGEVYTLPEGANALALLGLEVDMWHDDGDVAFYEVTTDADDVIYDTVDSVTAEDVTLLVKDDTFDWADKATVFENFDSAAPEDIAGTWGRFVLDDDGDVVFACVFDFSIDAGLVKEVADDEVTYLAGPDEKSLDLGDYDSVSVYDAKLGALKVEDIKADSLIYGFEDDDNLYLVVAGQKKEGELAALRTSSLTLDGTKYDLAASATFSLDNDESAAVLVSAGALAEDAADLLGEAVAVILDINGDVRHVRGDVAATTGLQFGVALKGSAAGLDTPAKVKILTADGVVKTYELEDEDDYAETPLKDGNVLVAFRLNSEGQVAEGQLAWLDENTNGWDAAVSTAPILEDLMNDYAIEGDNLQPTGISDDHDYLVFGFGTVYITEDTAIFNEIHDPDDTKVDAVAWAEIEDMNVTSTTPVRLTVVTEAKGADVVAMYFNDGYAEAVTAANYGVVLEDPWLTADGWKVKVDVYGEGEKEYLLADDVTSDEVGEGDVVEFNVNPDGELTNAVVASTETVSDVSGRYLDFGAGWVRIADDAVLYQLDEDGKIDGKLSYTEIEKNDSVRYEQDAETGRIVALVKETPKATYTLTISQEGQGTVTPAVGTHTYAEGTVVNLSASAATGWTFSKWEGPVADTSDPTTTVTMEADKSVKAVFVPVATYAFSVDKTLYKAGDPIKVSVTNNSQSVLRVTTTWTLAYSASKSGTLVDGEVTPPSNVNIYPGQTKEIAAIAGLTDAGDDGDWTMTLALFDAEDKLVAQGTVAFQVDATAPAVSSVTFQNKTDGTLGSVEAGDSIVIVFSEAIEASTINASLASGPVTPAAGDLTVVFTDNDAAGDTIAFGGSAVTSWNLGTFAVSGNGYVEAGDASQTANVTSVSLSGDGKTLTLVLGAPGAGVTIGTSGSCTFAADADITDLAGNGVDTTAKTVTDKF